MQKSEWLCAVGQFQNTQRQRPRVGLLHHVRNQRTWCAIPVNILWEHDTFVALAISPGTRWLAAYNSNGRVGLDSTEWKLDVTEWVDDRCIYIFPEGEHYGVGLFGNNTAQKYYINGQAPVVRRGTVVETLDMELDALIDASSLKVKLKDYDKFWLLQQKNILSESTATRVHSGVLAGAEAVVGSPALRAALREMWSWETGIPQFVDVPRRNIDLIHGSACITGAVGGYACDGL